MALVYTGPTTITISPASLATSSTFLAGRECTEIDNRSNLFLDALVRMLITVGTTPTANTLITPFFWGAFQSLATSGRGIDTLDGTDSAETITSAGILQTALKPGPSIIVDATTSDRPYPLVIRSVAAILEMPVLPPFWGFFLAHNTGANLKSGSGDHWAEYEGLKF